MLGSSLHVIFLFLRGCTSFFLGWARSSIARGRTHRRWWPVYQNWPMKEIRVHVVVGLIRPRYLAGPPKPPEEISNCHAPWAVFYLFFLWRMGCFLSEKRFCVFCWGFRLISRLRFGPFCGFSVLSPFLSGFLNIFLSLPTDVRTYERCAF